MRTSCDWLNEWKSFPTEVKPFRRKPSPIVLGVYLNEAWPMKGVYGRSGFANNSWYWRWSRVAEACGTLSLLRKFFFFSSALVCRISRLFLYYRHSQPCVNGYDGMQQSCFAPLAEYLVLNEESMLRGVPVTGASGVLHNFTFVA